VSSSPEVVRERRKAIQSGLEALEKLESAGTAPADLKRIRAALEALDLEQLRRAASASARRRRRGARGQKLRRRGVQLLAKHRKRILERFDLERALVGLEHSYRVHLENQVRKALSAQGEAVS
jgi:hypothetical protein